MHESAWYGVTARDAHPGGIIFRSAERKRGRTKAYDHMYHRYEIERTLSVPRNAQMLQSHQLTLWWGGRKYPEAARSHFGIDNVTMQLIKQTGIFDVFHLFQYFWRHCRWMRKSAWWQLPSASLAEKRWTPAHRYRRDIAVALPHCANLSAQAMMPQI